LSIEDAKEAGKSFPAAGQGLQKISTRSAATVVNPTRRLPAARLYGQAIGSHGK
jgi:hypothetical protein